MCYVAAFEKRGGRETLLACDFGVVTLVPPLIFPRVSYPTARKKPPPSCRPYFSWRKAPRQWLCPWIRLLAGLPCFLCIPARRYSSQQPVALFFSGVPGSTTSRPVPTSVPASTRSLYVFCCCCLSSCRCCFCPFGVFAKPTSHGIRLTHLLGLWLSTLCGAPLSVPGLMFEFHYFACVQVMSMMPDTNLDAKCFEDAPVPVEEREFQING